MAKNKKSFFASYSRLDGYIVEPIVKIMRATLTPVFLDVDSIEAGSRWRDELGKRLNAASTVVVFWSRNSAASEWVEREWRAAIAMSKEVIPVILDSTPMPKPLNEYQWIDFQTFLPERIPSEPDERRNAIIRAVRSPLSFFALLGLITFAGAIFLLQAIESSVAWFAFFIMIFLVILGVAFLAYRRPEALRGSRLPYHHLAALIAERVEEA